MTTTMGGVDVEDAHVDWHLRYSNSPNLVVQMAEKIPRDDIRTSVTWALIGENNGRRQFVYSYDGVYFGVQEGESFENRQTYDFETPATYVDPRSAEMFTFDGEPVVGTHMYHHSLRQFLHRAEWFGREILSARLRVGERGAPGSQVVAKDKADDVIEKYINGPLGSDEISYWVWTRDNMIGTNSWHSASSSRDRWVDAGIAAPRTDSFGIENDESWDPPTVELVEDDIAGWVPAIVGVE